jgi:putative ABC transport system permease protein
MFRSLRVALFLAPKAIVRGNLGITALTICMLAVVAVNLLFVPGLLDGIVNSSNKTLIENYSGDIIIESDKKDNPYINHVEELTKNIESIDGVIAASPRNTINATISYEDEHVNCTVIGIDPNKDKQVFDISQSMIEGQFLGERDRNDIVLGVQLAGSDMENIELYSSSLRYVHPGDKVDVVFANGQKTQYTVKGVFHTGLIQADIQAFITNIEFESISPITKNRATSIRVKLQKGVDPDWVISEIGKLQEGLKFKKWEETAGIIESMNDTFKIINQILNIVNILIAGITVFIVTYVDVVNRKRQIGIQRAIGIKPRSIILSYLFRALFYAVMGIILGMVVYRYILMPLEARHPFTFPFGPAYLGINTVIMVRTIIILIVVSIVASFLPVWRVMRKTILDAIWG